MGISMEGLIFKGSGPAALGFQQSYPQKIWKTFKSQKNQALRSNFKKTDKP